MDSVAKFLRGDPLCPVTRKQLKDHPICYMRIEGDEVVSSWGGRIPHWLAIAIANMAERCRTHNLSYPADIPVSEHIPVGDPVLTRITPDGSVISGCHTVLWPQIEAIRPHL